MPLLTTRLYLFCVPLTKHVTEPHLPFFFFLEATLILMPATYILYFVFGLTKYVSH